MKSRIKIGAVALAISVVGVIALNSIKSANSPIPDTTVMITTMAGNSGGSGVIIDNKPDESVILTNKHVCEILKFGGMVISNSTSTVVSKYRKSMSHDLCLVYVQDDLGASATIANRPPRIYEQALVSGHPNLYPTVMSQGHFSNKQVIEVLTGFKPCTKADEQSDLAPFCEILGAIPVINTYEALFATNLIMPGSSGSATYNSEGQLSALVFAGSGNLSYAFLVPYEYVSKFLYQESSKVEVPNYNVVERAGAKKNQIVTKEQIVGLCNGSKPETVQKVCSIILRDMNWRQFQFMTVGE